MGINLIQYHLPSSQQLSAISDLEKTINEAENTRLNLRKEYHTIAIILNNDTNYEDNPQSFYYKMMYGTYPGEISISQQCVGYLSSNEVKEIQEKIVELKLESFDDFQALYNSLKPEVINHLTSSGLIGDMTLKDLHDHYVLNFVKFYELANQNSNAVLVCIE